MADQKPATRSGACSGHDRAVLPAGMAGSLSSAPSRIRALARSSTSASGDDAKQTAKANIAKRLSYINDQLANRQFLVGSNFPVADAYAFTIVNWTNFVGIGLGPYPNVGAYMARVGARPKVQETLKAEGLLKQAIGSRRDCSKNVAARPEICGFVGSRDAQLWRPAAAPAYDPTPTTR